MSRHVLLIEDDENYRLAVKLLFDDEPYQFVEAASPEEGIAILGTSPQIRVILLDLSFDDEKRPGTLVLDHIKPRSHEYRVVVLTGHDELLAAEKAGEYDVFNYLPKAEESSDQAIRFSLDQAFKDLERQHLNQKLDLLLEVQKGINANRNQKEILDLICESVRSIVGAFVCHIRVYDFERGDHHLEGFAGPDEQLRNVFGEPKAKGQDFSGRVVESRIPEVLPDLQGMAEFQRFKSAYLGRPNVTEEERRYLDTVRSAYIVPLTTGLFGNDVVDAVLNVGSESLDFFGEEKRLLVDEFVNQAALAITKDWLQRKRDEISQISKMLADMSDQLRGTDLRGIYEVVTRKIGEIVSPEVVSIFLHNEVTGRLENVAELRGTNPPEAPNEFYEVGESLTGSVFKIDATIQRPDPGDSQHVRPLEDLRYREKYRDNIPSRRLEHYIGVPIRMGGKPRGVLRVMNKKSKYYDERTPDREQLYLLERGFSSDDRKILEITASHLAVAIRNAELLREKEGQVEQVRILSEVGRLISSEKKIDAILEETIREMADVVKAEICMLFFKEGDNRIVLKQAFGMPLIPNASYEIGEGVTGHVAETGEPRLIPKAHESGGKYGSVIRKALEEKHNKPKNIESLMVVPIIAKDQILGVMKVINKAPTIVDAANGHSEFGEGDLELFTTFGRYVGVAIENAKIYEVTNNELAIAKRNAALSLLVSAVAHEINNTSGLIPANVAGIRAQLGALNDSLNRSLALIEHEPAQAADFDEEVAAIQAQHGTLKDNINRRLALIERVAGQATDFAKELAGFAAARRGEKRKLDINEVIRSAIGDLQDLPVYRNSDSLKLEMSLHDQPLECEIFENPFVQIVRNIVINAFQALENTAAGAVLLSTSRYDDEARSIAVLQFKDNGPGIPSEYKEKIFDPTFTTKPNGNGLGLWLVRTQLEQVGGTIDVESVPGEGARFTITIPLS